MVRGEELQGDEELLLYRRQVADDLMEALWNRRREKGHLRETL